MVVFFVYACLVGLLVRIKVNDVSLELKALKSPVIYIGMWLFIGWVLAILANFSIYEYTAELGRWIHPVIDAILFMAGMLVICFMTIFLYKKREKYVFVVLSLLGILSLMFIILY